MIAALVADRGRSRAFSEWLEMHMIVESHQSRDTRQPSHVHAQPMARNHQSVDVRTSRGGVRLWTYSRTWKRYNFVFITLTPTTLHTRAARLGSGVLVGRVWSSPRNRQSTIPPLLHSTSNTSSQPIPPYPLRSGRYNIHTPRQSVPLQLTSGSSAR